MLTDEEARQLLLMTKKPISDKRFQFPDLGGKVEVFLQSEDGREKFIFTINRKRIALTTSYQTRARQAFVLARLDFGAPHRNPDGSSVGSPHLHLYNEAYGDRVAVEVPEGMLSKPDSTRDVLQDFMKYCNIQGCVFDLSLFS